MDKRFIRINLMNFTAQPNTVGINPILSDFKGPGTSKLDGRYLEHNKIKRNELQICTNSQKGTGTKMAKKFGRKTKLISALFLTQRPPDDWPDVLDNLAIGLVVNKYTNLEKQVKSCYLVRGCPI